MFLLMLWVLLNRFLVVMWWFILLFINKDVSVICWCVGCIFVFVSYFVLFLIVVGVIIVFVIWFIVNISFVDVFFNWKCVVKMGVVVLVLFCGFMVCSVRWNLRYRMIRKGYVFMVDYLSSFDKEDFLKCVCGELFGEGNV